MFRKKPTDSLSDFQTPSGFKRAYDALWEKVFAVCFHSTADAEVAKGMAQSIFQSLWERRTSITIESSLEHYVIRAAKMKVAEYFRNRALHAKHLDQIASEFCQVANTTEEDVSYSMLVAELDVLVEKLPCRCQEVYRMSRQRGLTNKEIASQLGISERAVEQHMSKALSFLRHKLVAYDVM